MKEDRLTLEAAGGALRDNAAMLDSLATRIQCNGHPMVVALTRGADCLRAVADSYERVARTKPERGITYSIDDLNQQHKGDTP